MVIFEKVTKFSMTKTDLPSMRAPWITAGDLRPAGDPSPAIDDFKNCGGNVWFCHGFCFRHNFSKNYPQDLKIV
jgi:hypothetical protein